LIGTLAAIGFYINSNDNYNNDNNASLFVIAFIAHYSCCCGDTWSSEIGVLSKMQPILIIKPWKKVVPGVNGGVSLIG
jgi:uncharacterized membrane protein